MQRTFSLLLFAMLVLALSCTPKDRRNRMTWVKPGNGYVLKDPVLAAKLKNLPTEIVDSGSRFSLGYANVDYFLCNLISFCTKDYIKKHGNRGGIVGTANLKKSPIEAGPIDEEELKTAKIQGKLKSLLRIRDVSIVQIYVIFGNHVYLPNPGKIRLRIDDSADEDGLGSIWLRSPGGPFWSNGRTTEKFFIIIEFSIGGRRHLIRSIPLVIF